MSLVIRCHRCEKDHEIAENNLKDVIDCPYCYTSAEAENFSAVMFCPECYAELLVPLDVLKSELQCPYCEKIFRVNAMFSLDENDDDDIFPDEKSSIFSEGDIYDKYKIISLLGAGGMGEVYLAQHMFLHYELAIKIMTNEAASNNPVYCKRFIREAKLTNRINSENIIKIFDVGKENKTGTLFIAMEYVHGRNIEDIIKKDGVMNETDILEVALKIAEVLIIC